MPSDDRDLTPAEPRHPVSSSMVIVPASQNGKLSADTLVKVAGWVVGAAIITASVIIFFVSSQASQDECIEDNEKSIIKIEAKIDMVNKDVGNVMSAQTAQGIKLDEILKRLPPNGSRN